MIIFNLDGTLADCEHRRHFVDPSKNSDYFWKKFNYNTGELAEWIHKETQKKFKPNWPAFYEACDKDKPIQSTVNLLNNNFLHYCNGSYLQQVQIWSERSEVFREKTIEWLTQYLDCDFYSNNYPELKMRPIGNTDSYEVLQEHWYNLHNMENPRSNIEFVFDSHIPSIEMWRRRGIFVFNCCQ